MPILFFAIILSFSLSAQSTTPEDLFFTRIKHHAIFGKPVNHTAMSTVAIDLISRHTQVNNDITTEASPYYIAGALRSMFLNATTHENDGNYKFILQRMLSNPDQPYWANCGSSSDLMIILLSFFGIDARPVMLFHTINDNHTGIEFYDETLGRYVFFDPLYGIFMIDDLGMPASIEYLMQEVNDHGTDTSKWAYQPMRISNVFSSVAVSAMDGRYEFYNSRSYTEILDSYLRSVAIRYGDQTPFQHINVGVRPGYQFERGGYWEILGDYEGTLQQQMIDAYSVENGGRYRLNFR